MTHDTKPGEKNKPMSRGEKIFDWLVYGGIAGVGTFIATIPIAFSAKYGAGAKKFSQASQWLQKKGVSPQTAEYIMNTSATMQGGNVMVLPVKWAEDHKIDIITKINDVIGEKTDVATLEKEDKQTWNSIIKARITAWITVFAGFKIGQYVAGFGDKKLGGAKLDAFEHNFSEAACKVLGKATHVNGVETKAFKYGKIAALDVFATTAASILLYVGSRFFAHLEQQKKEDSGLLELTPSPITTLAETPADPACCKAERIIRDKNKGEGFSASIKRQMESQPSLQLGA